MKRPIHILQVTKSTGGIGQYIRWLVHGLDRSRFALDVVCLSEGSAQLAAELGRLPGVHTFSMAMNRYHINPVTDAAVLVRLARLVRRKRYDLIHGHTSKPGYLARLAAAGSGVPVIYQPNGFAFHAGAGKLPAAFIIALERLAARYLTARLLTVCDGERDMARKFGVGREEQYSTIHTGIDWRPFDAPINREALRAELGVPAHAPLVGSVGRLIRQKAPLDFVRAAACVRVARPETHFIWVGSGPLEAQTRALAAEHGLTEVFHLAGERRDIAAVMQTFDLFVLTSRWEGFALVVLEAMAARLPIVATRVTGTPEAVLDGATGWLVPPGDPAAIGQAITKGLANPAEGRRMGAQGRQRLEQYFGREQMIRQIEQLYETVVAEAQPGRERPPTPRPL